MTLHRQPAQRPIPVERAIRWLPLDDPFYMLATVLVSAKAEPLFVAREVLVAVETHLRAGAEDDALGVIYGATYFCSKSRISYLLAEGVERASVPSREHDRDAGMAAELRALARSVAASGKLVVGWYHGGADLAPRIGLREIALHLAVCSEPWQVALLRSGTAPDAPCRGAVARVEPTERRVYPIPFVELLPNPSRDPDSRSSAVAWTNYRSETPVSVLTERAFHPSRVSGPVSNRSRLSLLGALHGIVGGTPAAESAPAAPDAPAPADTVASATASAREPEELPRAIRSRLFTPPTAARAVPPVPPAPPEREVPVAQPAAPADAAPPTGAAPPVPTEPLPAPDAPLEMSAAAPAAFAPAPPVAVPPRPAPERDEVAVQHAPPDPDAGDAALGLAPLPLTDLPAPEKPHGADEPSGAPDRTRVAAQETAHGEAQELRYPATLGASTTPNAMPADIARIFDPAPRSAGRAGPDPDVDADAPSLPMAAYGDLLRRSRIRARLIAAAVVVLGLAGAAALFARPRTHDAPPGSEPETRPVSADTMHARPDTAARGRRARAAASDTGGAAMQGYARTRLASETSALAADVESLGAALQAVIGPGPRTSTDSLRRSMACARADSARTDAIMHGQAVQLARRYLTTPADAPAVARAAALVARADTLATALLSPCPPES